MGMVEAAVTRDGTPGTVRRYHLPSARRTAEPFSPAVRAHWRIATSLHLAPEVGFDADRTRKSRGHAAENLATPRKLARNLPRAARPDISIRRKPKRPGCSDAIPYRTIWVPILNNLPRSAVSDAVPAKQRRLVQIRHLSSIAEGPLATQAGDSSAHWHEPPHPPLCTHSNQPATARGDQ
jgi:hypothetical protein